ncbi:hypothetical protein AQUCO_11700007v1 [Aquilegia coerulea]|uniref:Uncharacterized protein n=1 Tax=Aquilegia coerulea TaxID=218851 RepID=A0A2G5C2B9_AQUCA|nr:hypothetical protein AQUCO_11700007v1 [Aquilegia coerulea]
MSNLMVARLSHSHLVSSSPPSAVWKLSYLSTLAPPPSISEMLPFLSVQFFFSVYNQFFFHQPVYSPQRIS